MKPIPAEIILPPDTKLEILKDEKREQFMTQKSKVAVIGLGNIGSAIATNLIKAHRSVIVADRKIEKGVLTNLFASRNLGTFMNLVLWAKQLPHLKQKQNCIHSLDKIIILSRS